MQKKIKLAAIAICYSSLAFAQSVGNGQKNEVQNESAFTFTESQLGEDDNITQNVTIINSNSNVYASGVGYLFSPVRFRYRAFNQKYNEVYINGMPMNDMESGQFRFSLIGGLNNQTRNSDTSLPFENNAYMVSAMAGSTNYDFRPVNMPRGHRVSIAAANRSYTARGVYSYNSGLNSKGWAFSAGLTYRWASRGYVEGTFYNSLSYFLGVQKVLGSRMQHSLSFTTWGNPTERGTQGAATDESYWLANDYQYNPYWGYQNGKKRNSRVVNEFSPSALFTWDWKIDNDMKLTTTLGGKLGHYSSTKLNYNNTDNPQPDYYKLLPSSYYDVFDPADTGNRTEASLVGWTKAYNYLTASKANRQVNWDRLYLANANASAQGADAMYYVENRHSNQSMLTLASTLNANINKLTTWNLGVILATSRTHHYKTMEDLLGATSFHNINTYALGTYAPGADELQYDLNHPNALVGKGDIFAYDYNIFVNKGYAWTSFTRTFGRLHGLAAIKAGGTSMSRDGKMRNGLFPNNSFGGSGTATFAEATGKLALTLNAGRGHTFSMGASYGWNAPTASVAFQAAEMNNDFVTNLKNERVFSSEIGYQYLSSWLHANVSAYYSYVDRVTEWIPIYFDDINSFSYVSLTNNAKRFYGVEAGLDFKLSSAFNLKFLGTVSEAKYANNANVRYLNSTKGTYDTDVLLNKGMRESGTPLTALSAGISYHQGGWYVDLNGNYYDRIYLSYSPYYRYQKVLAKLGRVDESNNYIVSSQDKGKGGFMLDGSIGRNIYLKKGSLSINLMVTNILNNRRIVTGGYEQSRSDATASGNTRGYKFSANPKKFYAYGTNGMLNITYKF
ncbi:TonB-dependent receptor [Prevotella sp. DNF00663]|uniref:TonB-dependent receptor n=1 Tax=Prevotella sp. DNF00663 TaxID=1384078 RepID=UPI0007850A20|nr:TonB-dependent receptor [Prevotella sp. DNF00663]KXB84042.1 TonB-dependent receptor [Prevotella sp. DNF00663]